MAACSNLASVGKLMFLGCTAVCTVIRGRSLARRLMPSATCPRPASTRWTPVARGPAPVPIHRKVVFPSLSSISSLIQGDERGAEGQ
jgi:hypothetical protein